MNAPRVSIVLVTRNGAATLPALLDAVGRQQFDDGIEIVAVDSSSTDGTADLLRQRADQVITIAPESFNHGLTRNLGIERSRGELAVLLVQDAVPASDDWLQALVAPLAGDARVAGAFARQLPRDDASAITRHYLAQWAAASPTPRIADVPNRDSFDRWPAAAQFEHCTFDDVCSCLRRSVWERHPFAATPFAEDLEWARTVLRNGYRIAYAPAAAVVHSHERSALDEFRRTRELHRRLYHLFGMRTIPTRPLLARAIVSSLALHLRLEWTARAVALAVAWPYGQYVGGRDGAAARQS